MSYIGIDPSAVAASGAVIQVQKAITQGRQTINSASMTEISGLVINFTPKSDDSTIILEAMISTSNTHVCSWGFYKDDTTMRTTTGNNTNVTESLATTYDQSIGSNTGSMHTVFLLDYETNTSTTQREYAVRGVATWSSTNYNLYINDRASDDMASFSTFTIWEIQN